MIVRALKNYMESDTILDMQTLERLTPLLRVFSHPLRLRIIDFLETMGTPQRVTDIVNATEGAPQAIVSQQLKILRESGILAAERQGNSVYYSLGPSKGVALLSCIRKVSAAES
jgi:DNA-binding transcriptional ArsR family regulator